jgi:hypothetical protein
VSSLIQAHLIFQKTTSAPMTKAVDDVPATTAAGYAPMVVRVMMLVLVGCSTPVCQPDHAPWNPDSDRVVAGRDAGADADARYRFDWQTARDLAAEVRDPHGYYVCQRQLRGGKIQRDDRTHEIVCLPADWPQEVAGQVMRSTPFGDLTHTEIEVDRGTVDGVDTDWEAAVLDGDGHLVSSWEPYLREIGAHRTTLVVDVGRQYVLDGAHVVLKRLRRR